MGYCGEKYDTLSSTIYLRARFYAPGLHHFMQQDSYIGDTGKSASRNTYAYCGGDPVNNCDPSGQRNMMGDLIQTQQKVSAGTL